MNKTPLIASLMVCSSSFVTGAIPFYLDANTATNGDDVGDSDIVTWSETATGSTPTVSNATLRNPNRGSSGIATIVSNTKGGVLSIQDLRRFDDNATSFIDPEVTLDVTFNFTESSPGVGSADIGVRNSNSDAKGLTTTEWDMLHLTGMGGLTSFEAIFDFSQPLAVQNGNVGDLFSRPFLTAAALFDLADGGQNAKEDFNVRLEYSKFQSATTFDASTFTPGLPSSAVPLASDGFGTTTAGQTVFIDNDGFDSVGTDWRLVRGYDYDGMGGFTAADAPQIYAERLSITVTLDNNETFDDGTEFAFSLLGRQFSNHPTSLIPEPTTSLMALLTGLGLITVRRRKQVC